MTYEDNNIDGKPLPQILQINNPYPGEPALMSKRSYPAILRFNKINKDKNPRKYMLSELMLYRPFREEFNMDDVERMYNEEHNGKRKVQIVKSQVMEHLEGVEEARYYVEQAKKQIDLTDVRNQLDPALEQNNADCEEEIIAEHPDFLHIDPDQVTTNEVVESKGIYRKIIIPVMEENIHGN